MRYWIAGYILTAMVLATGVAVAQENNSPSVQIDTDAPFELPAPVKIETPPEIKTPSAETKPRPECEIVIIQELEDGGQLIGYASAEDFLASVYDEDEGHINDVEGHLIRAVLCTREDIIPTLRDFPVLATGVPLSLSPDFDATDSRVTSLYFKDGSFQYKYVGDELSEDDQKRLNDIVEIFNFQPHDLAESEGEQSQTDSATGNDHTDEKDDLSQAGEVDLEGETDDQEKQESETP